MKNTVFEYETHTHLTVEEVNQAVILFVENLHLYGGSNGSIQLYKLMQAYLLNPDLRKKINEIVV